MKNRPLLGTMLLTVLLFCVAAVTYLSKHAQARGPDNYETWWEFQLLSFLYVISPLAIIIAFAFMVVWFVLRWIERSRGDRLR